MALEYNPDKHSRHSIRLPGFDYARPGAYFVTVCTQGRECLFGEVVNGAMVPNAVGKMVQSVWNELPRHYPGVNIDASVVMPNHLHGIIMLTAVGAGPRACPDNGRACPDNGQPQGVAPTMSLINVVHRFKSLTTARYRHGVVQWNWRPFFGRLWQRNYYERIIRKDDELSCIRQYIADNPKQWDMDRENPRHAL
jgi:REP element-mobilizing transposase RayT